MLSIYDNLESIFFPPARYVTLVAYRHLIPTHKNLHARYLR